MNPLHTIHVLYRYWRRRHHVWLVAKLWARSERRAKRRNARLLRVKMPAPAADNPHWASDKARTVSDDYMKSLKG